MLEQMEMQMCKNRIGIIEELVADCRGRGLTEPDEVIKHISGSYMVEERCTEKYADLLKATTAVKDE